MAEANAADMTLPPAPVLLPGVIVAVTPPALRLSLRARDPELLGRASGLGLPARIGDCRDGVAKLGPDEWYAVLPAGTVVGLGAGQPLSIVDVSSRAIGIRVEGPGAAELIGAGCPLDLASIAPGRATRTLFETVEIILIHEDELRFHIEVWRSFAPWLFAALVAGGA